MVRAIYSVTDDTVETVASVLPNSIIPVNLRFPGSLWSTAPGGGGGGGTDSIELAPGTVQVYGNQDQNIRFTIQNLGSSSIIVTSLVATYSTSAYFRYVDWDGSNVFNSSNPRAASDDEVYFNNAKLLASGQSLQIQIRDFRSGVTGGSKVDMSGTDFTIEFSDGSTIDFTAP
jgi:hypothetical protein